MTDEAGMVSGHPEQAATTSFLRQTHTHTHRVNSMPLWVEGPCQIRKVAHFWNVNGNYCNGLFKVPAIPSLSGAPVMGVHSGMNGHRLKGTSVLEIQNQMQPRLTVEPR